jgi:aryl-alcohol dehydrogenase-like predicted oxidoreductase
LKQLEPIAQRHGATIGQLVIAWTAAQPGITCVLCGARDPHQAIENAAAGSMELSAEEVKTIGDLIHA